MNSHPAQISQLAAIFLRIGTTGFGGPLATISMMEEELVRKKGWLSHSRFFELYAVCKLLPGPLAPQVAISVAKECGGVGGGIVSGIMFVLPSFLLILAAAVFYSRGPVSPELSTMLLGVQIGAIAVILSSLFQLFKPYVTSRRAWIIGIIAAAFTIMAPSYEPVYIVGAGFLGVAAYKGWFSRRSVAGAFASLYLLPFGLSQARAPAQVLDFFSSEIQSRLLTLFWICFKSGAFIFGTGIAIIPLLENDFVTRLGWISHSEFMDAVAMGQVTPGPFVITATFIGYRVAGVFGACIATVGMFGPSFFNVLVLVPRVWNRFSGTPAATAFVKWAIPAVAGCILAAAYKLGYPTFAGPLDFILGAVLLLAVGRFKLPAWVVVPGAGLAYWALRSMFT